MFNRAIRWHCQMPKYLSSDHDPLYRFGQWQANLRILEVAEIKTVPYVPLSHPFVERLIGTIRRECLDWMILLIERHLRRVLREWVAYYNRGRPHASLGPVIPDGPDIEPVLSGHRIREGHRVVAAPILGGLHHDYRLEPRAA
jgi:hypothetical protein